MSLIKQVKDHVIKILWNGGSVPSELFDLAQYFRNNGPIHFEFKADGDETVAISKDFRYGTIITSAKTNQELDERIKDAILTAFEVPSSYKKDAGIHKIGQTEQIYAFA